MAIIALIIWTGKQKFRLQTRKGNFNGTEDKRLHCLDKEELANEAKLLATAR